MKKEKKDKNKSAVLLGKKSWEKRTEGMSRPQIRAMMSSLKKGKKKKDNLTVNA